MDKLEIAVHEFMRKKEPQNIYDWDPQCLTQPFDIRMDATQVDVDEEVITAIADKVMAQMAEAAKDAEDRTDDEETKAGITEDERKQRIEDSTITTLQVLRSLNPDLAPPAFNQIGDLKGYTHLDGPVDAFNQWLKTGDSNDDLTDYRRGGAKAAWQEGDDTLGGHTVPEGMWNRISEKRDEVSIARIMGAEVIPVGGPTFNILLKIPG